MPSYKNISSDAKTVNGILFKLNTVKTTEKIIHDSDLELVDYEPFYNPVVANHIVEATGNQEIEISIDYENTKIISIWNDTTTRILMYINSLGNSPGMYIHPNSERSLEIFGEVEKLIFAFPSAATIYVEERKKL